jgi:hypothetical protein
MTNEELVANHSVEILGKLITDLICKDPVEIRFDFEDEEQWAIVTMHYYDEDKEISLRLYPNNRLELYYGYYDNEDEYFEIIKPLSEEEKAAIPKGLKKIMGKVLTDEQGMRLPGNLLSK